MSASALPAILWGGDPANGIAHPYTLQLEYPLDSATTYAEPRGVVRSRSYDGSRESVWDYGDDWFLRFTARYVDPGSIDAGGAIYEGFSPTPAARTSYWGGSSPASGWQRFLTWAQTGWSFVFRPDATASPMVEHTVWLHGEPEIEQEGDLTRRITLTLRSATDITGY